MKHLPSLDRWECEIVKSMSNERVGGLRFWHWRLLTFCRFFDSGEEITLTRRQTSQSRLSQILTFYSWNFSSSSSGSRVRQDKTQQTKILNWKCGKLSLNFSLITLTFSRLIRSFTYNFCLQLAGFHKISKLRFFLFLLTFSTRFSYLNLGSFVFFIIIFMTFASSSSINVLLL